MQLKRLIWKVIRKAKRNKGENTSNTSFKQEKPKNLLQEYFGFLRVETRDVQKFEKSRGGLVSIKPWQPIKEVSLMFIDRSLVIQHCSNGKVVLRKIEFDKLQKRLKNSIKYIEENLSRNRWDFIGNKISQNVYSTSLLCPECQVLFSVDFLFDGKKILDLLFKLQEGVAFERAKN
jgi:hypothetical protein